MPDVPIPSAVLGVTRSLSGRRWVWQSGGAADADRVALGIAQRAGVTELVGRLLAMRGVRIEEAADYLAPTLRALLPDPSRLRDMDMAAERLARAVVAMETVAVFGDYDVDGACSSAVMMSLLRGLGCTVLHHVPDRILEGYGPNAPALEALVARGATLIVCVDCGSAAGEALAAVAGRTDVLVLDHHKIDAAPLTVLATVNPNRLDCTSGLGTLCATAVAFLAAVACVRALRRQAFFASRAEPDLLGLLDLVALATVCDMMPLVGLNRALVSQGLKVMARRARPGVVALLDIAQSRGVPNAHTCGFALGPRINAGGRLSEADMALRLLMTEDADEARLLAARLDAVNRQRQEVEAAMLEAAHLQAAEQAAAGNAALLVCGERWHPGVVGIVAGRIRERQNRPACVAAISDGVVKGSGRSVPGLDLGAAVIAARQSGLLLTGGGHTMAAGFSLVAERIADFHAWLNERLAAAASLPAAADLPVAGTLSVAAATCELATEIARLAPFGNGNDEPVFALPRCRVSRADRVGRDGATVRAFVEGEDGGRLKALLFRAEDGALAGGLLVQDGRLLHLAGHLRAETWNGAEKVCLHLSDSALAA